MSLALAPQNTEQSREEAWEAILDLVTTSKDPLLETYCAPTKLSPGKLSAANVTYKSSHIVLDLLKRARGVAPDPLILTRAGIKHLPLLLNFAERCVIA